MNYTIWADTDIGIRKKTNQDSLSVRLVDTVQGRMAFAVLCDGMGGLSKGEVASATVVKAFSNWIDMDLPLLCHAPLQEDTIGIQWRGLLAGLNTKLMNYGNSQGLSLGTTVVAILVTPTNYYIINVGDSRVYEITDKLVQITRDQTVVAREISLGRLTPDQAKRDPRRNVLLQCIGASQVLYPEFFFGETNKNAVYMLCSDGFRHEITPDEIVAGLHPDNLTNVGEMKKKARHLIELNKYRQEKDNISVALIKPEKGR